ncbi:MAG: histidine phosphatase family protein [Roseiflexus sp.]|nr:histidine phosphatase family protein [Roseiflexus sp.]MCS7288274.1 histidine phosphatase family protein [Roseiflexus sp.]MDW8145184.1 histidine phosphatase family protein [Roseiflexaceae bacterium]MDW8234630.1 histidine phosphatase family protein [Roseiflexaceae bacterium]
MRTAIWLVRHGQTLLNKQRRYQGATDSPLTSFGIQQAQALAHRLRRIPFTVAVISPYERVRATAAAVLQRRTVSVVEDARWSETNHGRWEGLTYAEVRALFPDEALARFADTLHGRAQGGESLAEVNARVLEAWDSLLREYRGGRILVVTHATPIQLILCSITGLAPTDHWRWRIDLGSLTVLDVYNGGTIVRVVNETPPLARGQ